VPLAALLGAGLTLFTGFGLATVLTPVVAIFFPLQEAILLVAVVHLLNNLFRIVLLGRAIRWQVVLYFGLPALVAAFVGTQLMQLLTTGAPLYAYTLGGRACSITWLNLSVGLLMLCITWAELNTGTLKRYTDAHMLPLGGVLSGLLGGFSGHQGALRSAFLVHAGLSPAAYIATGVAIAILVDLARMVGYAPLMPALWQGTGTLLLGVTIGAAFIGSYVASRLVQKVTVTYLQRFVAIALSIFALLLIAGVV